MRVGKCRRAAVPTGRTDRGQVTLVHYLTWKSTKSWIKFFQLYPSIGSGKLPGDLTRLCLRHQGIVWQFPQRKQRSLFCLALHCLSGTAFPPGTPLPGRRLQSRSVPQDTCQKLILGNKTINNHILNKNSCFISWSFLIEAWISKNHSYMFGKNIVI